MLTRSKGLGQHQLASTNEGVSGQAHQEQVRTMSSFIQSICYMCNGLVSEGPIKCGSCTKIFHPSSQCTGLKPSTIQTLQEEDGVALQYRCTACRCQPVASGIETEGGDNGWRTAIGQVLEVVRSLATNMNQMSETINNVLHAQQNAAQTQPGPNIQTGEEAPVTRKELYSELFEFEERKKRVSSIIVRGTEANNIAEFTTKFKSVHQHLLNVDPQIADIHCISQANKMFGVTYTDKASKVQIMSVAKNLASSAEYRNVFISRDLTLAQRNAIKASRAQRPGNRRRRSDRPPDGAPNRDNSRPRLSGSNTVPLPNTVSNEGPPQAAAAAAAAGGNFQ